MAASKKKAPVIKKGQHWRRKRDKLHVVVDRVGRTTMDIVTVWNLTVYTTTRECFLRNHRPETAEEEAKRLADEAYRAMVKGTEAKEDRRAAGKDGERS